MREELYRAGGISHEVFARGEAALEALFTAEEADGALKFSKVVMEPYRVYNIPATLWHNTITRKDTKMILIEDSSTSMDNSDIYTLSPAQIEEIRTLYAK